MGSKYGTLSPTLQQLEELRSHAHRGTYGLSKFLSDVKQVEPRLVTEKTLGQHLSALRHSTELAIQGKPIPEDQLMRLLHENLDNQESIDAIDPDVVAKLDLRVKVS